MRSTVAYLFKIDIPIVYATICVCASLKKQVQIHWTGTKRSTVVCILYRETETEAQVRWHLQCRSAAQPGIRRGFAKPPLILPPLARGVLSLAFSSNIWLIIKLRAALALLAYTELFIGTRYGVLSHLFSREGLFILVAREQTRHSSSSSRLLQQQQQLSCLWVTTAIIKFF